MRREGLESEISADSAGTTSFHVGSGPDRRAREAASSRGIRLEDQRARQITAADLQDFDYVLVMDRGNYEDVLQLASRTDVSSYIGMLMDYAAELSDEELPDPYYGAEDGFKRAIDLTEAASVGLLEDIRRNYLERARV